MSSEESNILVLNDFPMDSPLAGSQWRWQRFSSPFGEFTSEPNWNAEANSNGLRLKYADWLNQVAEPGLYIWLLPRPSSGDGKTRYRFVHVGMSIRNVAERLRDHCRNQFRRGSGRKYYCTTDRIHELPVPGGGDDYGLLPKALYDGDLVDKAGTSGAEEKASIRRDAALEFLRSARVVVLSTDEAHEDLIRVLENVVGCAADILLRTTHSDVRQTTRRPPAFSSGRL